MMSGFDVLQQNYGVMGSSPTPVGRPRVPRSSPGARRPGVSPRRLQEATPHACLP